MTAATWIAVDEYLATAYHGGDYVDGEVFERNAGECEHSYVQMSFNNASGASLSEVSQGL
jgi:hypothetical protein